jgi:hypothetical protein
MIARHIFLHEYVAQSIVALEFDLLNRGRASAEDEMAVAVRVCKQNLLEFSLR